MKDLIKEIEGLKLEAHPEETEYRFGFRDGNNTCVVSVKHILTQHHLITAPKQIKLSEVVNRLKDTFKDLCNITYRDLRVINHGLIYLEDDIVVTIDKEKNIILNIEFTNTFIELKWLYTLWIAETEIVDDMEE